jgi:hypothetical protein
LLLKASTFINTLVLSQHEGGECLNDTVKSTNDYDGVIKGLKNSVNELESMVSTQMQGNK